MTTFWSREYLYSHLTDENTDRLINLPMSHSQKGTESGFECRSSDSGVCNPYYSNLAFLGPSQDLGFPSDSMGLRTPNTHKSNIVKCSSKTLHLQTYFWDMPGALPSWLCWGTPFWALPISIKASEKLEESYDCFYACVNVILNCV